MESEPGYGSNFHFTVRLQEEPTSEQAYLVAEQPELKSKTVLVVDDNATSRDILRDQLVYWDIQAQLFATGSEANQWLKTHHADALILDLQAPMISGETLSDAMEQVPTFAQIPLILLSTSARRPLLPANFPIIAYLKSQSTRPACTTRCCKLFTPPRKQARLKNIAAANLTGLWPTNIRSAF